MTETLQEFCDWRGVRMGVDRQAGVIRGVKILGLESRNGRSYLPEALAQAAAALRRRQGQREPSQGQPRRPARLPGPHRRDPRRDGPAATGCSPISISIPSTPLAEQLLWDAEHAPENVGFSHNVEARTARRGDRVVVEAITRVQSVDLVADPATTRGLFESQAGDAVPPAGDGPAALTWRTSKRELSRSWSRPSCQEQAAEVPRLRGGSGPADRGGVAHQKREQVRRLLREFHLPEADAADPQAAAVTSPRFVESLLAAPDERAMRELVEERARLVRSLRRRRGASGGLRAAAVARSAPRRRRRWRAMPGHSCDGHLPEH